MNNLADCYNYMTGGAQKFIDNWIFSLACTAFRCPNTLDTPSLHIILAHQGVAIAHLLIYLGLIWYQPGGFVGHVMANEPVHLYYFLYASASAQLYTFAHIIAYLNGSYEFNGNDFGVWYDFLNQMGYKTIAYIGDRCISVRGENLYQDILNELQNIDYDSDVDSSVEE